MKYRIQRYDERIPHLEQKRGFDYMPQWRALIMRDIARRLPVHSQETLRSAVFVAVSLDRLTDEGHKPPEYWLVAKACARAAFYGEHGPSEQDPYLDQVNEFVCAIKTHPFGDHIFEQVLQHFSMEYANLLRRWRLLPRSAIQELQIAGVAPIFGPWLHIIEPTLSPEHVKSIVHAFSAAKLADDLADAVKIDIPKGFINIAREEIRFVTGLTVTDDLVRVDDTARLEISRSYLDEQLAIAERRFEEAQELLLSIASLYSNIDTEPLLLFASMLRSWLDEAKGKFEDVDPFSSSGNVV